MRIKGNVKDNQISLPSFAQFLKTIPLEDKEFRKFIRVVWFPNKFPNFTVDTESFRLRIPVSESNQLELTDEFESSIESDKVLCVVFNPSQKGEWAIEELEGELGDWEELGSNGFKCSVREKPKGKSKRVPKKPG